MTDAPHLKVYQRSDLEEKDQGPRGKMNVVGVYQTECSVASALAMAGDRNSERYQVAAANIAAASEYLMTKYNLSPSGIEKLAKEFSEIAAQRSRSMQMRRTGIPAVTCRND